MACLAHFFLCMGSLVTTMLLKSKQTSGMKKLENHNQKQPSCKKRSAALEKAMVKKDVKSKVAAKKWL